MANVGGMLQKSLSRGKARRDDTGAQESLIMVGVEITYYTFLSIHTGIYVAVE